MITALNGSLPVDQQDLIATVARLSGESRKADLPRESWPMMVRFRDINDPKSVEQIDPAGVGSERIRLETTHDPVTTGITGRLTWLSNLEATVTHNVLATSADQLLDGLRRGL